VSEHWTQNPPTRACEHDRLDGTLDRGAASAGGAVSRCLGALWHRVLEAEDAVPAMYRGLTSASRSRGAARRGVLLARLCSTLMAGEESWDGANRGVVCAVLEPRGSRSGVLRRNESRAGCCCLPPGSGEHDGVGGATRWYSDEWSGL